MSQVRFPASVFTLAVAFSLARTAAAEITLVNVTSSGNGADGVRIDSVAAVTLTDCDIHSNASAGVRALRAEDGLTVVDGALLRSRVHDNAEDGIVLGDPLDQTGRVFGVIRLTDIFNNAAGVRVRQKDLAAASTRTTMHGNNIYENRDSGIHISTSYLQQPEPRSFGPAITSNKVFHNGFLASGCSAQQIAPQIAFVGPVAVTPEEAARCATANPDPKEAEAACNIARLEGFPCFYTGSMCIPVWDIAAESCTGPTVNPNQIHSYNTNNDPVGSSELSVGLYASNGAEVDATSNDWRTGIRTQDVDQDASSFVHSHPSFCAIVLQCESVDADPARESW